MQELKIEKEESPKAGPIVPQDIANQARLVQKLCETNDELAAMVMQRDQQIAAQTEAFNVLKAAYQKLTDKDIPLGAQQAEEAQVKAS